MQPCYESNANITTKAECDVCMEILRLLEPGCNEWFSHLGNFKHVMISTKCGIHPRMFRSYFNIDLENAHISEFEASAFRGSSVRLNAKRVNGSQELSAWALYPVFDIDRRDPTRRGKILNTHWIEKNIIRDWKRGCDGRNNKDCQICPAARRLTSVPPS